METFIGTERKINLEDTLSKPQPQNTTSSLGPDQVIICSKVIYGIISHLYRLLPLSTFASFIISLILLSLNPLTLYHFKEVHHGPSYMIRRDKIELYDSLSYKERPLRILDTKIQRTHKSSLLLEKILYSRMGRRSDLGNREGYA